MEKNNFKNQEGNPQLEDGFVKIANELVEVFCGRRLSGEEWQIIWSVLNKTYRWHKKEDWISLSQFVEMTGMQKSNISRALKKLLNKKIIIKSDNKYMFNKHYKEWSGTLEKKEIINTDKEIINTDKSFINTDKSFIKNDKSFIKNDTHKIYYTKDTITKENKYNSDSLKNKENNETQELDKTNKKDKTTKKEKNNVSPDEPVEIPEWLDAELWEEFRNHRKAIKRPLTPYAEKLLIKKLDKWRAEYDINEIIETSIINGWQGLFLLKKNQQEIKENNYYGKETPIV